jgi:hypothetical protein
VKYQIIPFTDINADTLEHSLLDHNNESMNDNIQEKYEETVYSEVAVFRSILAMPKSTERFQQRCQ